MAGPQGERRNALRQGITVELTTRSVTECEEERKSWRWELECLYGQELLWEPIILLDAKLEE